MESYNQPRAVPLVMRGGGGGGGKSITCLDVEFQDCARYLSVLDTSFETEGTLLCLRSVIPATPWAGDDWRRTVCPQFRRKTLNLIISIPIWTWHDQPGW